MFVLRDWLLSTLRDDDDDDDEEEDVEKSRHGRKRRHSHHHHHHDEDEDDFVEEGEGEAVDIDYVFLEELEDTHSFNESELVNFYMAVRKAYAYELLSSHKEQQRVIEKYVHTFLAYLCHDTTNESFSHQHIQMNDTATNETTTTMTTRVYPRILYHRIDEITPVAYCMCIDKEEMTTFRVDKRLDFVYTYVLENAIVDSLEARCSQVMRYGSSSNNTKKAYYEDDATIDLDGLLNEIEQNKDLYRTRSSARYMGLRDTTSSDAWILYTRRSSSFFRACMAKVENQGKKEKKNEEGDDGDGEFAMKLVYSVETLHIETIPFQQVLLLCGHCAGFTERYACEPRDNEGPFVVATEDTEDWVSVPIWFALLV